jgi:hypothetical protein
MGLPPYRTLGYPALGRAQEAPRRETRDGFPESLIQAVWEVFVVLPDSAPESTMGGTPFVLTYVNPADDPRKKGSTP